ncbi:YegP family protein [Rhodococcus sp. NPDC056960]|uniref:YegP family protein n=1 Tax=Rhodococcus sp. NPDC056960 TaxID=3345982 RepID=UPI00363136D0
MRSSRCSRTPPVNSGCHLKAANGEIVAVSQGCTSKVAAENGIVARSRGGRRSPCSSRISADLSTRNVTEHSSLPRRWRLR